jgi:hypothetical protein
LEWELKDIKELKESDKNGDVDGDINKTNKEKLKKKNEK